MQKYDFYFDSFSDKLTPEGLSTKLVFAVLKEGRPVDCKIQITDLNEIQTLYSEETKKTEIASQFLNKQRIISYSELKKLTDLSNSTDLEKIGNYHKFFLEDRLEINFSCFTRSTSSFHLPDGYYLVHFQVDDGNGNEIIGKSLVKKSINSNIPKFSLLLKEIDCL